MRRELAVGALGFLSLVAVSMLWLRPVPLAFVLLLLGSGMLYLRERTDLYLFVIAGVAGAVAEAIAILSGAWTYSHPTFLGIPVWLPVLWGVAAVFILNLDDLLEELEAKPLQ